MVYVEGAKGNEGGQDDHPRCFHELPLLFSGKPHGAEDKEHEQGTVNGPQDLGVRTQAKKDPERHGDEHQAQEGDALQEANQAQTPQGSGQVFLHEKSVVCASGLPKIHMPVVPGSLQCLNRTGLHDKCCWP